MEQQKLRVLLKAKIFKSRKLRNVRKTFWKGICIESSVEKYQKGLTRKILVLVI